MKSISKLFHCSLFAKSLQIYSSVLYSISGLCQREVEELYKDPWELICTCFLCFTELLHQNLLLSLYSVNHIYFTKCTGTCTEGLLLVAVQENEMLLRREAPEWKNIFCVCRFLF